MLSSKAPPKALRGSIVAPPDFRPFPPTAMSLPGERDEEEGEGKESEPAANGLRKRWPRIEVEGEEAVREDGVLSGVELETVSMGSSEIGKSREDSEAEESK